MARGIRLALALALVVSLGVVTSADASSRLTRKEAKRMAVKLGRKQVRRFDLRFYDLGRPRRIGPRGFAFPYAARTRANTYCKATLRVHKRTRGNRILLIARIGRQRCIHMPDDAFAIETATRKAQRAVRQRATLRSLVHLILAFKSCENMRIPRSREPATEAMFESAFLHSLYDPNLHALNKFADRLDLVDTTHVVLADAVAGWLDFADLVHSFPRFPHLCATLRKWKRHHWSASAAPIDLRNANRLNHRLQLDYESIFSGARFLRRVGAYPRVVDEFDIFGLVLDFGGGGSATTEVDTIQAPIRRVRAHIRLK